MSRWVRVVTLCALAFVCSGCLRYHVQLQVRADGTVSGQLVVAFRADLPVGLIQQYQVPPQIRDRVTVTDYQADGYAGSTITFDRLGLDEVADLFGIGQRSSATVQLAMTRSGDQVLVTGEVFFPDLSMIGGNEGFDARIALSFAGAGSVTGNGAVNGDEVAWTPRPGMPMTLSATAVFPQAAHGSGTAPARRPVSGPLLAGLVAVLAGVVALLLARRMGRRALGPAAGLPAAGLPAAGLPAAGLPAAGLPAAGLPAAGLPAGVATAPAVVPAGPVPTAPLPTAAVPTVDPVGDQPTTPLGPYAGPYPMVPPGPGLSPESTLRQPTVPLPDDPDPSHGPDQAGW